MSGDSEVQPQARRRSPTASPGEGKFVLQRREFVPAYVKNLMDQYRPAHRAQTEPQFAEIKRRICRTDFRPAVASAEDAGLWRLNTRGP